VDQEAHLCVSVATDVFPHGKWRGFHLTSEALGETTVSHRLEEGSGSTVGPPMTRL